MFLALRPTDAGPPGEEAEVGDAKLYVEEQQAVGQEVHPDALRLQVQERPECDFLGAIVDLLLQVLGQLENVDSQGNR